MAIFDARQSRAHLWVCDIDDEQNREGESGVPAESPWRLKTTKVLLMALVREHLQCQWERIVVATLGRRWQITRARLLRDFVERSWARMNKHRAADVPEIN